MSVCFNIEIYKFLYSNNNIVANLLFMMLILKLHKTTTFFKENIKKNIKNSVT